MRERRLLFGEVADLYDRYRPAYPGRLVDDLVALAGLDGGRPVLEVGAGTGKATVLFAARGLRVVAIEPSAEMAAVARSKCSAYPGVELELGDFEHWDPQGRRFPLLFSAQAWHWVRADAGYAKARQALSSQGILAAFWNRVAWDRSDLREALLVAYRQSVPELKADSHMLHPANLCPDRDADWEPEIAGVQGFTGAEIRYYEWDQSYSAAHYAGLLATLSEIRLLDEPRRAALLAAVTAAIEARGEPLVLPMRTRLCLARRS
jgi:SAM-dependent methyltransferase